MRAVALAVLAIGILAACDKPQTDGAAATEAASSVQPPKVKTWQEQMSENPVVLRTYPLEGQTPVPGAKLQVGAEGLQVATAKQPGSYTTMLYLGPLDDVPTAIGIRIKAQVTTGKLYFISSYENAPSDYKRFETVVKPGDPETILLPRDKNGRTVVIVANASGDGASAGVIQSIELLGPAAS